MSRVHQRDFQDLPSDSSEEEKAQTPEKEEKKHKLPSFQRKDTMEEIMEEDKESMDNFFGANVENPMLYPWGPPQQRFKVNRLEDLDWDPKKIYPRVNKTANSFMYRKNVQKIDSPKADRPVTIDDIQVKPLPLKPLISVIQQQPKAFWFDIQTELR